METIKFKKQQLANYSLIKAPGKFALQVASNVTDKNLYTDENSRSRHIVNLKAIAIDKLSQVQALFQSSEEVEIDQTNGLFLTASIWAEEGKTQELPMKGETVDVTIDNVVSREGEEVLRVTNIRVRPSTAPAKLSLASLFEEMAQESGSEIPH